MNAERELKLLTSLERLVEANISMNDSILELTRIVKELYERLERLELERT